METTMPNQPQSPNGDGGQTIDPLVLVVDSKSGNWWQCKGREPDQSNDIGHFVYDTA